LIPQFDFRFIDAESFTPFVLQGATPRPIHLEDTRPPSRGRCSLPAIHTVELSLGVFFGEEEEESQ
jgi:hypothetical protein